MNNNTLRGRFQLKLNVFYELKDNNGNVKPIFTENKLGQFILGFFRKFISPIDENAQVKPGFLNHIAAYGIQIPIITGSWGNSRLISNLTTTTGKAGVASRINGSGAEAAFTFIAVGTGATAAAIGDATLETELAVSGLSRVAASASRTTTDTTNDTATLATTFTVTGTAAVTESGVLNAGAVGVLLARQVFSALNVVNGDSLTITWNFDVD